MPTAPRSSDFCIFRRTASRNNAGEDTFIVLGPELSGVGLRYRTLAEAQIHAAAVAESARAAVWYYASETDGGVLLATYWDD
jgi:hypothetical protein